MSPVTTTSSPTLLESATTALSDPRVAGWLGALGLLVTVVGFAFTLWNVAKSKKFAKDAADAVDSLRSGLAQFDAATACATVISALEEIERMHRNSQFANLPDRYTVVRKIMVEIATSAPRLTIEQQTKLQAAITQIAGSKDTVEVALANGTSPARPWKFNKVTSNQIQAMTELMAELRNSIGR